MVNAVANKLLDSDEVTYVGKSIGEHTIDLRVETIVKDNASVLDILEKIKAMEGVNDVVWSEIVSVVGKKISIPSSILDKIWRKSMDKPKPDYIISLKETNFGNF